MLSPPKPLRCLGVKNQIPSCCLSIMLSLPKPLDEIQPNLECELLTWMGRATAKKLFGPTPWWPWGEVKGQISLNFGYHVNFKDFYISKIFIPNFVCVLTNPRGGTLGHWGCPRGQKKFFFQTWSCSISNRWGWQAEQNASKILILGSNWWPWGEVKRSYIINMSISMIFIPYFVCVLTNKR